MTYDDMNAALTEAERTMTIADNVATKLARLLVGRLRKVNGAYTLRALKTELAKYNMHTGNWRP